MCAYDDKYGGGHRVFIRFSPLAASWEGTLFFFLKDCGENPWFDLSVDDDDDSLFEHFDVVLSREDGEFNWGIVFEPDEREGEGLEEYQVRAEAAVEVLIGALRGLEKVSEVVHEDRELIMVAAKGWRSPVRDIRKLIKETQGLLAGMKVDPDIEDNR